MTNSINYLLTMFHYFSFKSESVSLWEATSQKLPAASVTKSNSSRSKVLGLGRAGGLWILKKQSSVGQDCNIRYASFRVNTTEQTGGTVCVC